MNDDTTSPALVRSDRLQRVATVTLDSPTNANALSRALVSQLRTALEEAFADPGVRVVVLTGAGRVFCSGADLKEAMTGTGAAAGLMAGVIGALWESPKPVVCRVNGSARAGGLGLVAACDIAIAPAAATFAFSEVRNGVAPAVISVPCLRRMPSRAAAEYFLTGEVFGAPRAAEIGLLTRAVAVEDLDGETDRYVGMLLRGAPGALAETKNVLRDAGASSVAEELTRMSALSGRLFRSDEAREGMTAFAEKRDPEWVGSA
jgi:methylglutaconyl-CoA hydratase